MALAGAPPPGAGGTGLLGPDRPPDPLDAARRRLRALLDRAAPAVAPRWTAWTALAALYLLRVWLLAGFYIVTYGLAIYNLNLLLGFLTPLHVDAAAAADGPSLPRRADDEFRPFVRRLPEFKFWWASLRSLAAGLALTLFPAFDVPVFWPILVVYWAVLFSVTMRRQVAHMVKYRYVPFSLGKKAYGGGKGGGRGRAN